MLGLRRCSGCAGVQHPSWEPCMAICASSQLRVSNHKAAKHLVHRLPLWRILGLAVCRGLLLVRALVRRAALRMLAPRTVFRLQGAEDGRFGARQRRTSRALAWKARPWLTSSSPTLLANSTAMREVSRNDRLKYLCAAAACSAVLKPTKAICRERPSFVFRSLQSVTSLRARATYI